MARMEDYSLIVYWDEDDKVFWGYVEEQPNLMAHASTFLECIGELDLLLDAAGDNEELQDN